MNIECLHSQLVFDCFPLVLAMNVLTDPNTLHDTFELCELSLLLLFDTFLMRVVLGDGQNLTKTLS